MASAQTLPSSASIGALPSFGTPVSSSTLGCPSGVSTCLLAQLADPAGAPYTSPYAGAITQWSVTTAGSGEVALVVLRQVAAPATYQVVSSTPAYPVGPDSFTYTFTSKQQVAVGDRIAVQATGPVSVNLRSATGGTVATAQQSGTTAQLNAATGSDLALWLSATVTRVPIVFGVSPATGPSAGGTAVTILGQNFDLVTSVTVGGVPAPFTVGGFTSISATTPAGTGGTVPVVLRGPVGDSTGLAFSPTFAYAASAPPAPPTTPATPSTPTQPSKPVRCKVPNLRGRSLAGARATLQRAHCRLGRVARHGSARHTVVVSQSPRAHRTLARNAHVNVVLG
jgi:hypothetical protein